MNKEELIELLKSLNFPKSEYYILSSGVLLFYGLREKAEDLDLCISEKLFNEIKNKYNLNSENKNKYGFYKLLKNVEVVVDEPNIFKNKFDIKEGYQLQKLEDILEYKRKRNLDKDKKDVQNITNYLKICNKN